MGVMECILWFILDVFNRRTRRKFLWGGLSNNEGNREFYAAYFLSGNVWNLESPVETYSRHEPWAWFNTISTSKQRCFFLKGNTNLTPLVAASRMNKLAYSQCITYVFQNQLAIYLNLRMFMKMEGIWSHPSNVKRIVLLFLILLNNIYSSLFQE